MLRTAFGNTRMDLLFQVLSDCGEAGIHIHLGLRIGKCALRSVNGVNGLRNGASREQGRAFIGFSRLRATVTLPCSKPGVEVIHFACCGDHPQIDSLKIESNVLNNEVLAD